MRCPRRPRARRSTRRATGRSVPRPDRASGAAHETVDPGSAVDTGRDRNGGRVLAKRERLVGGTRPRGSRSGSDGAVEACAQHPALVRDDAEDGAVWRAWTTGSRRTEPAVVPRSSSRPRPSALAIRIVSCGPYATSRTGPPAGSTCRNRSDASAPGGEHPRPPRSATIAQPRAASATASVECVGRSVTACAFELVRAGFSRRAPSRCRAPRMPRRQRPP